MNFTNKSAVRECSELAISEEFLLELDKKVEQIIKDAEKRAKANNRRTLYSRDL
jgi:hypothetical protein